MTVTSIRTDAGAHERPHACSTWLGRAFVVLSLFVLTAAGVAGQEVGKVLGRVVESGTGQPVPHAQVFVENGPGTLSDLNGRFILNEVPAGVADIAVQALGYGQKTITGVEVPVGGAATLDITVESQAIQVEGVRVSAERERGSTAYLLDERRSADAMVEAVGSAEISRRPDSDAADVAQRMTGVTVSEGKYVFVRGLGERYSQTTLNGSSLPSPEPEKEVVPLDLFPSGFLQSLQTQKTYTPDLPADFSGGTVKIEMKDFPSRFGGKLGVSTSFNTESQFTDGFLHYGAGGLDWLGLTSSERELPSSVQARVGDVFSGQRLPRDDAELVAIGQSLRGMDQAFGPQTGSTPVNRSIDLSVGGRTGIGEVSELGYFLAGTYSDRYTVRDNETEWKWRSSAFRDETAELAEPDVRYDFLRGLRNVSWGTIANVAYKLTPEHQIGLKTTVNVNTDHDARLFAGDNREDIGGVIRSERARFVERVMLWGQLSGEHLALWDSRIDWRLTGARATRDEPLLRESIYLQDEGDGAFYLHPIGESGRYFSSGLVDDDMSAELDWRIPFPVFDRAAALKVGGAFRMRQREFGARRLNWDFLGNTITDLDAALETFEVVPLNPRLNQLAIEDVVEPGDVYDVDDQRYAGYAVLELPLTERLDATVGARVETYSLELHTRAAQTGQDTLAQDLQQTDIAPALNLVYSATPDIKVRAAFSRTVDRPEFRELAPFQFTEATSLRQLKGNPELVPAEVTSADLRFDWFWGPTEMLSLGGFYKMLDNPIERVYVAAASSAYSFQNAESATLWGIETDLQMGLGRIAEPLRHFGLQANYSRIFSEVTVRSGGIFQPTNLERPLEGQAPYVFNAGISYARPDALEAGVYVNQFGERLAAAGGSGVPDIYEQPRTALDATLAFPVAWNLRAKLKGTNLLDEQYRFEQESNGITRAQRVYTVGRTFSVGLSWEF